MKHKKSYSKQHNSNTQGQWVVVGMTLLIVLSVVGIFVFHKYHGPSDDGILSQMPFLIEGTGTDMHNAFDRNYDTSWTGEKAEDSSTRENILILDYGVPITFNELYITVGAEGNPITYILSLQIANNNKNIWTDVVGNARVGPIVEDTSFSIPMLPQTARYVKVGIRPTTKDTNFRVNEIELR